MNANQQKNEEPGVLNKVINRGLGLSHAMNTASPTQERRARSSGFFGVAEGGRAPRCRTGGWGQCSPGVSPPSATLSL